MGTPWTATFEDACRLLVERVCDRAADRGDRDRAWRDLLTRIGPRIEGWAATSPLLRQVGLAGEDEGRAVLVAVIERLAADDFANLRRFLEHRPAVAAATVDDLDRLARAAEPDTAEDTRRTPLRAWLITLVKFAERDHVRARLGWGEGDKRSVGTGADRLPTDGGDLGARPPVTDALTLARIAAELRAAMATFPAPMHDAIELWMTDVPFDEIATRLGLADAATARGLVRAGQARLRERFREQVPLLFGA
ncbi:MAG: hypothetical protein H6709_23460 [Kofleriaceae bacterium]|nr:hypothetical protein [Myxococcales bacterium]MCB9562852.1 hypothetical protein [Kofleriaceae bacterium]MCB9575044.1 hypothetical protein [Kofleriaceae bacterium]